MVWILVNSKTLGVIEMPNEFENVSSKPEQKLSDIKTSSIPAGNVKLTDVNPTMQSNNADEFKYEESVDTGKTIITIAAKKGCGKTRLALGLPGKICALSFDRKTTSVKNSCYDNDPRIKVFDAVKYYSPDSDLIRESAVKSYNYILWLLDRFKREQPDWIVFDGAGVEAKIAEFVMRHREKLQPYQGVANRSVWKIRNAVLDTMHQKAVAIAKKGVIYTTYTEFSEIVQDGTTITKKDIPKYVSDVLMETDIVLMIDKVYDVKNHKTTFFLRCDSSKFNDVIETGFYEDITDRKVTDILNIEKRIK